MAGGAGRPNSGDSGEGIGRERVWGGGGAHPRSICHLAQGRGAAGGVLWRRRRLPTVVAPCSSEVAAGARNGRLGKLLQMLGKVGEGSVGLAVGRNPELAATASNGVGGGSGRGRRRMRSSPCGASFIVARCPLAALSGERMAGHGQCSGGARAARTGRSTGK
jgi:hypothetical protein